MNTSILIQARLGSSRLPGKVLMELADQPMIWHVIKRCQSVGPSIHVAVVTTTEKKDDPLAAYLKDMGIDAFRGSEQDVLDRYYRAAAHFGSDVIVRVTSDCPLLDPGVTEKVIAACGNGIDFSTNVIARMFPRGLDTEVMKRATLDKVWREARDGAHREHVTKYIYDNQDAFKIASVANGSDLSAMRWTVDEKADYDLVSAIYSRLYRNGSIFQMDEIVRLLEREPELAALNAAVRQKLH